MRLTLALAVSLAGHAFASGSTPPLPLADERFESFEVCLVNLQNIHTLDVKRIDPAPETREDGSVLQRSLVTDGVVTTGPESAAYQAEYGVTVSARDAASGQIRHQYSWERVAFVCTGGTLSGVTSKGYSSPSFEPAP